MNQPLQRDGIGPGLVLFVAYLWNLYCSGFCLFACAYSGFCLFIHPLSQIQDPNWFGFQLHKWAITLPHSLYHVYILGQPWLSYIMYIYILYND